MADPTYDRRSQDVGNILGLEHVNLVVTDRDLADRFYISALGFTRDPYVDLGLIGTTWLNIGSQQLHLAHGPEPQRFRGRIGLVVPEPPAVVRRLERLIERVPLVADSEASCQERSGRLTVTCPWGNQFRIHGPDEIEGMAIGMPYVEVDIAPGKAAGVAAFYADVLQTPTTLQDRDGATTAVVAVGRHQEMRFRETSEPLPDYDGHHVAIYLGNFSQPYEWLRSRGFVTQETNAHEYRFEEIVDPESAETCAVLEHEVRSMFHPMFARGLVNRDLGQGLGTRYRQGHDVRPGLFQSGLG